MAYLAFYKGKGSFSSRLIRLWTRGPYSHVEWVLSTDGKGMNCASASARDGGVRQKTITIKPDHWDMVKIPPAATGVDQKIAKALGKKYDWAGIFFSQIMPLARQHPDRWFCSEFCAHLLGLSQPHRYSPNGLYYLINDMNRLQKSGGGRAAPTAQTGCLDHPQPQSADLRPSRHRT